MPHFFVVFVVLAILKLVTYQENIQIILAVIDLIMLFGVFLVVIKGKKYINYALLLLYIGKLLT